MLHILDPLRELNTASVLLRLALAALCGGVIGLERAWKQRPAGVRTYMLVCLGAALTMLLGQYQCVMLEGPWADAADGLRTDVGRLGAQVISGIGFLGAGTILVTGRQQVKGLTTAAGLWASACMGLAVGAGFYECVLLAFLLILLSVHLLLRIEHFVVENARNMNLFVEFQDLDQVGDIIGRIQELGGSIQDVDLDDGRQNPTLRPSAVFSILLDQKGGHDRLLAALSELEGIYVIHDV